MGPPGGGRNDISSRMLRHMNIVTIDEFDDATMTRIFGSICDQHFAKGFEGVFLRNGKVSEHNTSTVSFDCFAMWTFFFVILKDSLLTFSKEGHCNTLPPVIHCLLQCLLHTQPFDCLLSLEVNLSVPNMVTYLPKLVTRLDSQSPEDGDMSWFPVWQWFRWSVSACCHGFCLLDKAPFTCTLKIKKLSFI